ncbi:C40 family peptidase [Pedobacter arcticus]|uniref:peptidoglycan-binding protein n=1 Tax=Pedobacter arcticus TaxID=752140 RepID=UPI00047513CC|nr:peptidoglycan-binding protein [Pedobacter arcticus]
MATIRILLGIICLAAIGGYRLPHRTLLAQQSEKRQQVIATAEREIGVREKTGRNDGASVEKYLSTVGLKQGQPWCAAFISWVFQQSGFNRPRTGWSPALFNPKVNTSMAREGNVFGIWFPNLKRIAHVGLVERKEGNWIISIEGNTNIAGSREGDGVYRKRRLAKSIYAFADWIKVGEDKP